MEYPGYGVYKYFKSENNTNMRAQQILEDAECLYRFVRDTLKVEESNILVQGRSIGSGPACHLAKMFKPSCLLLISPIKSVKDVARQKYGKLVDLLIEERFDNYQTIKKVTCPAAIFHGTCDTMVPY